ncbi:MULTISPECIES: gamma-glutamyl-gamma-aminobutyrate hydrolase family protein [unclassified Curtobacterium]|uniref:gamma-glutamyl-gamma-aminobutyrate hydrolase family protein n=1 Tax=unclassified Curtobacterium TaxID=257496 RepID=UPI0037FBA565
MQPEPRPVLAVVDVSDADRADPAFHDALTALTSRAIEVARAAGWEPRRFAAEQLGVDGLDAALSAANGVLVMGGEDVAPAHYEGDDDYEGRGQHFAVADAAQIAAVRRALAGAVPTLGICRGMQVVNVALGGDLVQHLDQGGHVRPGDPAASMVDHPVLLEPDSRLAAALGAARLEVRSSHHQAVGRVGDGLRVVATAPDGTVEAVEHVSAPLWAVQWHPEDSGATGTALRDLLVAMLPR